MGYLIGTIESIGREKHNGKEWKDQFGQYRRMQWDG